MASISDYAKLTPPPQFRPEEDCVFRLQISESLVGYYGTLVVYGYTQTDSDGSRSFDGTKMTLQLNSGIGGQWYQEYLVPGGTLGFSPTGTSTGYLYSGKMQAKVEIGQELDEEGNVSNPLFTSNVVLVDMLVLNSAGISWLFTPYNTSSSRQRVSVLIENVRTFGASGNDDVQSYRFWLYDKNKNLLRDTGELYDWDTNIYGNVIYTYYDLSDNTQYYVRCRITMTGGYYFYCDYEPINVNYANPPELSEKFTAYNEKGGITLELDLSGTIHTSVVFTRTEKDKDEYLEIGAVEDSDNIIIIKDKYPIPTRCYIYKAVVYNGINIVDTYYTTITCHNNYITISDIFSSFTAVGNITKHPISRNERGTILEAMDSKYPYHIINGAPDYDSGSIDAFFADVEDCEVNVDNGNYSEILRAWLNNGRAKLLTYYTGEAWIVTVSGIQTTDPENNDVYNTTFNWTQIGDASRMSEYMRLGLVMSDA